MQNTHSYLHFDIKQGETAIHYAVKNDRLDLLHLFINRSANLEAMDYAGNTILLTAILWSAVKCIDLILSTFIVDIDSRDSVEGQTSLIKATMMFSNKVIGGY